LSPTERKRFEVKELTLSEEEGNARWKHIKNSINPENLGFDASIEDFRF